MSTYTPGLFCWQGMLMDGETGNAVGLVPPCPQCSNDLQVDIREDDPPVEWWHCRKCELDYSTIGMRL